MTAVLSDATLNDLPAAIQSPGFDRGQTDIGIVHLGPGAFHRAHQAAYTNDAMSCSGGHWAICGVSLRSSGVRDAHRGQDYLYTLAVHDEDVQCRVIGSVKELLVLGQEYEAVIARLTNPATRIVTLTITEHGYCLDSEGNLDLESPGVRRDLAGENHATTAIGLLTEALRIRRASAARTNMNHLL